MEKVAAYLEHLCCPRCRAGLIMHGGDPACSSCGAEYRAFNEVACLMPAQESWVTHWRTQTEITKRALTSNAARFEADAKLPDILESTRQRLKSSAEATTKLRDALGALMAPLFADGAAVLPAHLLGELGGAANQTLLYHLPYLFRDWAWGDQENAASLAAIVGELAKGPGFASKGTLAVLGAGGCRLALDLHQALAASQTFAVDTNPLLLFAAHKLIRGKPLELHEFPTGPLDLESTTLACQCAAPAELRKSAEKGFHLILGDARQSPIREPLDAVVTPWLIDVVSEDLRSFLPRINRMLKPGGIWVSFGPLGFLHPEPRKNYSLEETLEIAKLSGFGLAHRSRVELPHLKSPGSSQTRRESIHCFVSVKTAEAPLPPGQQAPGPLWIENTQEPVPFLPQFASAHLGSQFNLALMTLIDGTRSISEMAKLIAMHQPQDPALLEGTIKRVLLAISQRQS